MILPADLRRKYGWRPGQVLEVHDTPDGLLLKPAPLFLRTEMAPRLACCTGPACAPYRLRK
jgi:AbrB family looped-hinge helix DNA binding protein